MGIIETIPGTQFQTSEDDIEQQYIFLYELLKRVARMKKLDQEDWCRVIENGLEACGIDGVKDTYTRVEQVNVMIKDMQTVARTNGSIFERSRF